MKKNKILIIEDTDDNIILMEEYLIKCDFDIDISCTVVDALSNISMNKYNLILLDLNLPDYDGSEVLKFMRKKRMSIPVIIISGYSDLETKLKLFKLGCVDYIIKPIYMEELEARIWIHLGSNIPEINTINKKAIFEIKDNKIIFKDEPLHLTNIEFKILSQLINNNSSIISREALAKSLSSKSNVRTVDYHIRNIRKKLKDTDKVSKYLITEYGLGYRVII